MEQENNDKKTNSSKKVVSVILMIVGIVLIVWFSVVTFSDDAIDQQTTANLDTDTLITNEAVDNNTNTSENSIKDPDALKRDEERVLEIEDIRGKLASYNTDNGNYPENLDELIVEGYYEELPVNPTPGGIDYVYTPIGSLPAKFYDLAYSLEAGIDDLDEGEHIANPDSIAFP